TGSRCPCTSVTRCVPLSSLGMCGATPVGYWVNHTYHRDGAKGVYPLFSPNPATVYPTGVYPAYTTAYVNSVTNRTYYLSDYFAVWGEPIGKNNTVGYTSPPQSSAYPSSWTWWMCVAPTQSSLGSGLWGG